VHALKPLRHHGMSDDSLRDVYKAVVFAKLLYASPAWWGFTSAADEQRLETSLRRATRLGFYSADDPRPSQLAADMDGKFDNPCLHTSCATLVMFCTHSQTSSSSSVTYCQV